ncbi:putative baseplate assembly protein [Streptomyces roseifaciens]|uniref:putative baseplate assembly protein n=1 Tax=Streptomyces roseifaciens TaxID=1488406 RepID=UPI000717EA81|nr:putative baseplate assembly protein [Streptomyces roseifaciens]
MSSPICRCGCRTATGPAGPARIRNRPGLPELSCRAGTHGQFLDAMLARLPAADRRQLARLTHRETDDPSVALLDAWAVIGDILTFYQERITNEGYLGTATEQESLTRLGRLVGHCPRPALGAGTFLAYTLDPGGRATIPAGSQVKSTPLPGGLPQTFETSEDLHARAEWNQLPVRRTEPPDLSADRLKTVRALELSGIHAGLRPGDRMLFSFPTLQEPEPEEPAGFVVRTVHDSKADPEHQRTTVYFATATPEDEYADAAAALVEAVDEATGGSGREVVDALRETVLDPIREAGSERESRFFAELFDPLNRLDEHLAIARKKGDRAIVELLEPVAAAARTLRVAAARATNSPELEALIHLGEPPAGGNGNGTGDGEKRLDSKVRDEAGDETGDAHREEEGEEDGDGEDQGAKIGESERKRLNGQVLLGLTPVLAALARPPSRPPAGSRDLTTPITDLYGAGSDALTRLLAATRPQLAGQLYQALGTASVTPVEELRGIQWLRVKATPYGATIGKKQDENAIKEDDRNPKQLTLDAVYDAILPGTSIVLEKGGSPPLVRTVETVTQCALRAGENLAFPVTRLTLTEELPETGYTGENRERITVWAAGEPLAAAEVPVTGDIMGDEITLDDTREGLAPGRWLVVSGERTDVPYTTGVRGTELVMLGGVHQRTDIERPGDRLRTTLVLTTELAYSYRRETVVIQGNVVPATAGESVGEVIGSGDAAQAGQTFPLRRTPLTWLPAATPTGAGGTLTVRVGGVAWHETDDLAELGPEDRGYRLRTGPDGEAAVTFGDGVHGARLHTGTENVTAAYRVGGGSGGNLPTGQVNQVVSRPLGVSAVTNPLPATGGTDADGPGDTRSRVPLRLRALDRIVSLRDHEDFARAYAGIGKASAQYCQDIGRRVVQVTVATVGDTPVGPTSPLLTSLEAALNRYGDPALPVVVALRERVLLVVSANVRVLPDHRWDDVEPAVRRALHDALGFARAELAQPVHLSTAIAAAQAVPGVDHVDVDVFGGIPDDIDTVGLKGLAEQLTRAAPCVPARRAEYRELPAHIFQGDTLTSVALRYGLSLDRLVALNPGAVPSGDLGQGGTGLIVGRGLRAAQLVVLDPAVPETLVLRRIQ